MEQCIIIFILFIAIHIANEECRERKTQSKFVQKLRRWHNAATVQTQRSNINPAVSLELAVRA